MIRLFLLATAAIFAAAALTHFGVLTTGYEHQRAATAETVIGSVLLLGFLLTLVLPGSTRVIALAALAFALLGTLVGVVMVAIGVGPRTGPDIAYHAVMVVALLAGLVVAVRTPPDKDSGSSRAAITQPAAR